MVWDGIGHDGSTDIYVIRNAYVTDVRYHGEILAHIVRPFSGAIVNDFIMMDDNIDLIALVQSMSIFNKKQVSAWLGLKSTDVK